MKLSQVLQLSHQVLTGSFLPELCPARYKIALVRIHHNYITLVDYIWSLFCQVMYPSESA